MGLPEIFINFQTAAVSAITRSAQGALAVALTDATGGGAAEAVYKSLAEVPEEQFTADSYRLLKLAFLAAPSKVYVLRVGDDDSAAFQALERLPLTGWPLPAWRTPRSSPSSRASGPMAGASRPWWPMPPGPTARAS